MGRPKTAAKSVTDPTRMSIDDLAAELGIDRRQLLNQRSLKREPGALLFPISGRRLVCHREDFERYVERCKREDRTRGSSAVAP